jgi:hypothetical protein
MMRDNRDKKEAIELLDKLENTTKIKAKKEKKYVIPKKEKEKFDKMRKDLGI